MTHTITVSEVKRLNEARRLQIERYRLAYHKKNGELPTPEHAIDPTWLRVVYQGRDCEIPIKLLTAWAGTFPDSYALAFEMSEQGRLTVRRDSSRLSVFTAGVVIEGGNAYHDHSCGRYIGLSVAPLPAAVALVAKDGTITAEIPVESEAGAAPDLAAMRAETSAIRKGIAKHKAIEKAAKAERAAKAALDKAETDAAEWQATVDSMTLAKAVTFARRCLAARRVIRAAMADLVAVPAWLPATYEKDAFWPVEGQDHLDRSVKTVDAREEHAELVNEMIAARAARAAYKPRNSWHSDGWYYSDADAEGLTVAAYKKAHPELATKVYGPAYDKLNEAAKRAEERVVSLLEEHYVAHCNAKGLPGEAIASVKYPYEYLRECRRYSRARLELRTWPQRRDELGDTYRAAVRAREAARAYDKACLEYHGEFAVLNFPEEHGSVK